MPSHKHKKKKKSHKRSKKHSSSSSENSCSPWRVPLSDVESDESSNQERLTSLVRSTYTNYLKQALTHNFEDCAKHLNDSNSESVEEMVHKWSSVLEQKAMRTCMVSELYRTSMVSLIRQIKASTSNKKLYIEDNNLSRFKSKIPVNKLSQTELMKISKEVETQTDFGMLAVVEPPLPSPSSRPYDPAIHFSDSNSSDLGVSSSLSTKLVPSNSVVGSSQDFCNISSTTDLLDTAKFSTAEGTVKKVNMDNRRSSFTLKGQSESYQKNVEHFTEDPKMKSSKNPYAFNDTNNITSQKFITIKRRQASIENCPPNSKYNLEERLSELGLFVDNAEDSQLPEKSKRSNWFAEEVAQACNLTRILMRMTTRQREKVLKKMKDLFGEEHGALTELSEDNISVCRKRIASVVVMELTPVYQAKKIASRHLFKFLAKKITRSIMEKSLAPDTKSIRWRVKKYFEDGKVIMSETDCM